MFTNNAYSTLSKYFDSYGKKSNDIYPIGIHLSAQRLGNFDTSNSVLIQVFLSHLCFDEEDNYYPDKLITMLLCLNKEDESVQLINGNLDDVAKRRFNAGMSDEIFC